MADYNSPYSSEQIDEAIRQSVANLSPLEVDLPAAGWVDMDMFGWRTDVSGGSLAVNTSTLKSALSDTPTLLTFIYSTSDASWQLDGVNVSLATYGIALTGAPGNGDVIVAEYAVRPGQTVTVPGASEDYTLTADLRFDENSVPSEEDEQADAWGLVLKYLVGTNAITFLCRDTAPEVDIPLQLLEA